ncbi:hypothetical protein Hanom_Chr04g00292451 [Helianthus anomalus]
MLLPSRLHVKCDLPLLINPCRYLRRLLQKRLHHMIKPIPRSRMQSSLPITSRTPNYSLCSSNSS